MLLRALHGYLRERLCAARNSYEVSLFSDGAVSRQVDDTMQIQGCIRVEASDICVASVMKRGKRFWCRVSARELDMLFGPGMYDVSPAPAADVRRFTSLRE